MIGDNKKASEYLNFLYKIKKDMINKSRKEKDEIWLKYYQIATKEGYVVKNLPKLLALIYPDFYFKNGVSFKKNLDWEKDKSFSSGISKTDNCQSIEYTNVRCIFNEIPDIRGKCQADHRWPNSLGGPSILDNRLLLCKYHNGMKSNEISHFNWNEIPNWLNEYLEKIRRLKI